MPTERILTPRLIICLVVGGLLAALSLTFIDDPMQARAVAIAAFCLVLWLGEAVPAFVPTLLLLAAVPLTDWSNLSAVFGDAVDGGSGARALFWRFYVRRSGTALRH